MCNKLFYPAIFTPLENSSGYCVTVPDLPGCVTQGDSLINAVDMGIDAASGWILGELEDGNDFPMASKPEDVEYDEGSFINLLVFDINAYT